MADSRRESRACHGSALRGLLGLVASDAEGDLLSRKRLVNRLVALILKAE